MNLSFRIKRDIDLVFDYLTDMEKFVSVHPVISRIDRVENGKYLVYETLKLGFIPFSFTYVATIEKSPLDKTVIIRAVVFKVTSIEMKFALKADGDYTLIDEEIQFKSLLPITFLMQRIFRKQHSLLFKNIEQMKSPNLNHHTTNP